MVYEPNGANDVLHAAGYGPPGGGGYGGPPPGGGPPGFGGPPGGPPPGGGGYGGPPGGGGYGGPPGGGGYGGPPGGPPPGGFGGPPPGAPPGGYGAPPPGFGPPGGGFPPPGGPMMPGGAGDVNTTLPLVLGIAIIFCGCWPAAIPAIIFAVQAKTLRDQGQIDAARSKAKTSLLIAGICGGLTALAWICYIIFFLILGVAGAANS